MYFRLVPLLVVFCSPFFFFFVFFRFSAFSYQVVPFFFSCRVVFSIVFQGSVEEFQDRAHHGDGKDLGQQGVSLLRLRGRWRYRVGHHTLLGGCFSFLFFSFWFELVGWLFGRLVVRLVVGWSFGWLLDRSGGLFDLVVGCYVGWLLGRLVVWFLVGLFYIFILTTSAVRSTNLASILIFASCVICGSRFFWHVNMSLVLF